MCEYCQTSPCPKGCPNAEEPRPVYRCGGCRRSIMAGDEYCELSGAPYCVDCLYDMPVRDLLKLAEIEITTAEG